MLFRSLSLDRVQVHLLYYQHRRHHHHHLVYRTADQMTSVSNVPLSSPSKFPTILKQPRPSRMNDGAIADGVRGGVLQQISGRHVAPSAVFMTVFDPYMVPRADFPPFGFAEILHWKGAQCVNET